MGMAAALAARERSVDEAAVFDCLLAGWLSAVAVAVAVSVCQRRTQSHKQNTQIQQLQIALSLVLTRPLLFAVAVAIAIAERRRQRLRLTLTEQSPPTTKREWAQAFCLRWHRVKQLQAFERSATTLKTFARIYFVC